MCGYVHATCAVAILPYHFCSLFYVPLWPSTPWIWSESEWFCKFCGRKLWLVKEANKKKPTISWPLNLICKFCEISFFSHHSTGWANQQQKWDIDSLFELFCPKTLMSIALLLYNLHDPFLLPCPSHHSYEPLVRDLNWPLGLTKMVWLA